MAKKNRFFLGAVIGGTVAAAAALLLAPKSGKELRAELKEQTEDWTDKAADYASYAMEKSSEVSAMAKDKAADLSAQMSDKSEEMKDKSEDALAAFKQQTQDLSQRFQKAAAETGQLMSDYEEAVEEPEADIVIDVAETAAITQDFLKSEAELAKEALQKATDERNQ